MDNTINFTAREFAMYEAGSLQGRGKALKEAAQAITQSLNAGVKHVESQSENPEDDDNVKSTRAWADSFRPWIESLVKQGEESIKESNAQVKEIGPPSRNLRQRLTNAIVGAVDGFKKG